MNKHKILFYLKKSKADKKTGEAPIYLRITVDGIRAEISVGEKIHPINWDSKANRPKGNKVEARTLSTTLSTCENKVNEAANTLALDRKEITAEAIKNVYTGESYKKHTLLEAVTYHNSKMHDKLKKGTCAGYTEMEQKLKAYLKYEYRKNDVLLDDTSYLFIDKFNDYMICQDKLCGNTAWRYLKNLKKVINMAIDMEWTVNNPFRKFKCTYKNPQRTYLSNEEIKKIEETVIDDENLQRTRDLFLFAINTGMAFVDLTNFNENHITIEHEKKIIIINRQKTGEQAVIPLLPKATEIINKYKHDPACNAHDKILPTSCYTKANVELKDVAKLCGIKKNLTFHLGRHTFATTILLSNQVPIETVKKALGVKSYGTMDIYAKLVNERIISDFDILENKIAARKSAAERK
ncbi:MAG: site-specific integrase [Bacteroidota bacterium]